MAEVEQSFGEQEVDEVPEDLDEEEAEQEQEEEEGEEEEEEEEEDEEEAPENSEVPVDAEIPENFEIPVVIQSEEKEEHESEEAAVGGGVVGGAELEPERKWPGWPGESVFRMLVPAQKVGSIIGRKGEFIKKIVEETRARIKILDGPPGTAERAVMVSGKEEPDSSLPPAMDGLLRVHKRIVDGLDGDGSQPPLNAGVKVSTRLLVPASQAGSLIGKQGATVKSIQESSNCIVRVLGAEDLPVFALHEDRVVEVVGEPTDVHKAIELIGSHLRKFLVDRSIIPVFEMQMQMASPQMDPMPPPPPHQSWGPPQGHAGGGPGYVHNPPPPPPQYMQPPRQHDNYYLPPAADIPPQMDKQPHHGILAYGREAPIGGHGTTNAQPSSAMGSLVTQQMQIPLSYADAVIGTSGASISYIRRASGSTVTIQESRANSTEMTVEISGSLSQVQTAQQLIHNFMADAAAAAAAGGSAGAQAQAQAQPAPAADQGGYNSYAAHGSVYASSPNNTGTGGYGSVYGTNYGY